MNIPKLSVRRPVTTIMVFTGIVLLGIISWTKLPQELFPSITYPQITVVTVYKNAAPEEIENLVTKVIEEAVGTVNNVKRIESISREGLSLVIIDFTWGTNMDFAALSVREKIDLIKEKLPRECEDPIVMKYNPFDLPIMNLAITGDMPSVELREITRKYIKEAIEKVDGVASATITGGDIKEILVEIDQARLRASQISIVSVVDTLKSANLNYPAGTIKESMYEYLIRTMGEFQTIEEIKDTPTALELPPQYSSQGKEEKKQRRLIYLRDIATIKESIKEKTSISRYNGKESISLVIRKQSGANTLRVTQRVKKEIKKLLEEKLPKGVNIKITYNQSTFIKEAISNLKNAGIQGGILAFFVLLFFLRDFLSSLTITLSIPISLLATFCLMYFAKINLNMMSLGGLALGIGMLVDNSIVVIENIFRHRQEKEDIKKACSEGAEEVFAPILGSTLTTIAVFLPFAFVVGIAGQIFKQLSFTITFSLLVSILVAISLIPVIISLGKRKKIKIPSTFGPRMIKKFSSFLEKVLKFKALIIICILSLFFISLRLLISHEKRFLPEIDQRQFIIRLDLPPGTRLEVTDSVVRELEKIIFSFPEVKDVTVNIGSSEEKTTGGEALLKTLGSHQAQIMVNLKKLSKKEGIVRSTKEIIELIKEKVERNKIFAPAQIEYIAQETSLGTAVEQTAPIVIEVRGSNLNKLAEIASQLRNELKNIPGLYSVKTSLIPPTPETKLHILKDKASLYGLSVRDIAITAQVALKGYVATKFKVRGEEKDIDIRVRLNPKDVANLDDLRRLLIRSPLGVMVPLSEVAYVVKGTGPTEIQRINQQRTVLVTANILHRPLKEIIADINKVIERISKRFPKKEEYSIELMGEQKKLQESFKSLAFALSLAIVLVYMIMASEFESLWQPFIIMFTVPLSLIGVTFILIATKTPLSVVAYLGIIMLGGIVVNNGIVLIDFINKLRQQGYSIKDATVQATSIRLRPIMMTSLTTILGMLPLALGIGEGAELRAPLARTVIGGLLSSTFLTLVFIPAIYVGVTQFAEKIKKFLVFKKYTPHIKEEFTPKHEKEKISLTVPKEKIKVEEVKEEFIPSRKEEEISTQKEIPTSISIQKETPLKEVKKGTTKETKKSKTKLNSRQKELLEKLKTMKKITRVEYAKLFGVSIPTAARDLKGLVDKGLIVGKGPLGPGRWYELKNPEENVTS